MKEGKDLQKCNCTELSTFSFRNLNKAKQFFCNLKTVQRRNEKTAMSVN